MSDSLVRLSERIFDEVAKINLAVQCAKRGWNDFQSSGNDLLVGKE